MEYLFPAIGIGLALLGIISAYYIAARQAAFHKDDVLLTLSVPTLIRKGQKIPKYVEVQKIRHFHYPDAYPKLSYPFMLNMPLLVTFGTTETGKVNALFLPLTVINRKSEPVQDVTIDIFLPSQLMPDRRGTMGVPDGLKVERGINEATRQGHIQYELSLKPYDCLIIPELIIIDPAHIVWEGRGVEESNRLASQIQLIRCIIRTDTIVHHEEFHVAAIKARSIDTLIEQSIRLGESLIDGYVRALKKPLLRRLLGLPYGNRTLLCIEPDFTFPVEDVAQHRFGKVGDRSKSEILPLMKR